MSKYRRNPDYIIPRLENRINGKDWLDYEVDKQLNQALSEIIGHPGKSGGKAQQSLDAYAAGYTGTAGYSSGQMDSWWSRNSDTIGTVGSGIIGMITSLIGMAHADLAAKKAYERQNEFYDNHISMPAKVQEYQEAGLNPMGLAGAGVGATSAPSVDSATTPDMGGITNLLGSILNYKLGKKQLEVEQFKAETQARNVASEIDYRSTQRMYQEKVNEWFEMNQIASISKMNADAEDALQRVKTGKADELLKGAGIEKTTAEAALSTQLALQKMWENSPEWQQNELNLKSAQAAANRGNAAQAYETLKNLASERDQIQADTFYKYALTAKGQQELENLGITGEMLKFDQEHQGQMLSWKKYQMLMGGLKDAGIGIGSAAAGIKGIGPRISKDEPKVVFPTTTDGPQLTVGDERSPSGAFQHTRGK